MSDSIALTCAEVALAAGREIRSLVHGMDPRERAQLRVPLLKPHGGYGARHVDAEAERVGLAALDWAMRCRSYHGTPRRVSRGRLVPCVAAEQSRLAHLALDMPIMLYLELCRLAGS